MRNFLAGVILTRGVSQLGPALEAALSRAEGDPLVINDVLQALSRFSLIRIDGERETFGIHRMVQEVFRAAMDDTPSPPLGRTGGSSSRPSLSRR